MLGGMEGVDSMRATIANLVTANTVPFALVSVCTLCCWVAKHLRAQWRRHVLNVILPTMVAVAAVWWFYRGTRQLDPLHVSLFIAAAWFYVRDARRQRDVDGWNRLNR